jgi:hypothetical protein
LCQGGCISSVFSNDFSHTIVIFSGIGFRKITVLQSPWVCKAIAASRFCPHQNQKGVSGRLQHPDFSKANPKKETFWVFGWAALP